MQSVRSRRRIQRNGLTVGDLGSENPIQHDTVVSSRVGPS
jgi:hypothetical protein